MSQEFVHEYTGTRKRCAFQNLQYVNVRSRQAFIISDLIIAVKIRVTQNFIENIFSKPNCRNTFLKLLQQFELPDRLH